MFIEQNELLDVHYTDNHLMTPKKLGKTIAIRHCSLDKRTPRYFVHENIGCFCIYEL